MLTRISRSPLILSIGIVFAAMPALGLAYTLCGYKWAIRQVPYYINPANADVSDAAAIAALQGGADAWSLQTNADFSFYYMGYTSGSTVVRNGKNEVFFRNDDPGPIAEAIRYYDSSGRIVEFDIVFHDGGHRFFAGDTGCSSGYYIQDTAAHEFGHGLGLRHSDVNTATMWPTATLCGTWKRSLDPDDIAGVEAMYPPSSPDAAPSVAIVSPANGTSVVEGTVLAFTGSGSDPEDGDLSSQLRWSSSRDGQIGTGASFSRVLSAGNHTITAAVSDSAGQTTVSSVSVVVNEIVTNQPPSVVIANPTNNTSVVEGASVTFSGSGSDIEDGNLTSKLVWSSNLSGPLGMGGSLTRTLSAGTHTITASVTDSDGATASRDVTVTVAAVTMPPPSEFRLSARAVKVKGLQYAELEWAGDPSPANVDIYRDGVRVGTTANDGAYTDAINRRGSDSYTYKVCAAGTSTCSNATVITF